MERVSALSMIIGKKPIIRIWTTNVEKCKEEKDFYLVAIMSKDNKYHAFCCPNCKAPVKIGYLRCKWCYQRLKWQFPFSSENGN